MAQAIAHGCKFLNCLIQFICLGREHLPVDFRAAVGGEHKSDFIQRETGGPPQSDERQALENIGIEQAA